MTEEEIRSFDFASVDVAAILPQRPPFVLVSRLKSFSFERTVTELDVRDDNVFIEDGCLVPEGLIENIAQTCAARIGFINKYILLKPVNIGYVCAVKDFKVERSPRFGETLVTTIDLTGDFGTMLIVSATVRSASSILATGTMTIALDDSRTIAAESVVGEGHATLGTVRGGTVSEANGGAEHSEASEPPLTLPLHCYVVKVSDNIVSPLGTTTEENYRRVKAGESALWSYPATRELPEAYFASLIDESSLAAEYAAFGIGEEYSSFERRLILSISKALQGTSVDPTFPRVLFIISSTKGNIELLDRGSEVLVVQPPRCARPHRSLRSESESARPEQPSGLGDTQPQRSEDGLRRAGAAVRTRLGDDSPILPIHIGESARRVAEFFGNGVRPLVVSNACISGLSAQIAAMRALRSGKYDNVIVSGSDVQSRFIISGFQSFKALSPEACRPFDADRQGLNLGEAAATIIYASKVPGPDDWTMLGGAVRNDANHISGPSRTGEGSYRALKAVLGETKPEDLALVSLHGTSTAYNDEMESIAVTRAGLAGVPVNSLKGTYGHTMGAAGILETILSMASVDDGTVLGTRGYSKNGVSCPLDISPDSRKTGKRSFVKLLSGFGGCNAAAIFRKGGGR